MTGSGAQEAGRLLAELRAALEGWRAAGVEWIDPRPDPDARPGAAAGEAPGAGRRAAAGAESAGSVPARPPGTRREEAAGTAATPDRPRPPVPWESDLFGNPVPPAAARGGRGGRGLLEAPETEPPAASLAEVRERLGDCRRCKLWQSRTNIVFGVGSPAAQIMFVGEGPGRDEDREGEPFVGRAGQLLTRIIQAMGMRREDVYIANVVKSRPPDNRLPEPDEIAACQPFLRQQIAVIRPRIIVALGALAAQTLLGTTRGITGLRGRFHQMGEYRVMPTFHPAYLLRNPAAKREVWDDMKQVRDALAAPGREPERAG